MWKIFYSFKMEPRSVSSFVMTLTKAASMLELYFNNETCNTEKSAIF